MVHSKVRGSALLVGVLLGGLGGVLVDLDHLWPGGRSLHNVALLLSGCIVACGCGLLAARVLGGLVWPR